MVTWGRAWSAAFAWLAWTLIYGIIGVILIVAGVFVMVGALNNLVPLNNLVSGDFYNSSLFGGFLFIVIGWIIIALGAIASFFKINSEIIIEEVNS
jgi:branched-subunit amino acid ABC-type transport system permease component